MKITASELAVMTEQANIIVSAVKEPVGYPGWLSQQHLFSMIAAISTVFKIDADMDALKTVINATSNIGMTKYKLMIRAYPTIANSVKLSMVMKNDRENSI